MQYNIQKNINILQIEGEEAFHFLHSIITNDLQNRCTYCFILSPEGRYMFDLFLHKINEQKYLAEINSELSDELIKYLNFYKLRKKVTITNISNEICCVYTNFNQFSEKIHCLSSMQDPRSTLLSTRVICKKIALNNIKEKETVNLYNQDKYQNCIPDGFIDMTQNKSIILEYGAEKLNAISYTKGCFPGQELMARTKNKGVIRKNLFKITAKINLENLEKNIKIKNINNQDVGIFCSGYQNLGIALLKKELVENVNKLYINNNEIKFSIPKWLKEQKINN